MADALDPAHLIGHVKDSDYFEVPRFIAPEGKLEIQQPFYSGDSVIEFKTGIEDIDSRLQPINLQLTKFMVVEVIVAVLVAVVFIRLANRIRAEQPPKGRWSNLLEAMLLFIRNQVARPAIGHHDADRFVPFLWTMFFFVLGCNLMGMVPFMGTATSALATTAALALITFGVVIVSGMMKLGVAGFWKAQVPHMDLPFVLAIFLVPMIFAIEVLGLGIKHFVLAMRLFANMLAGHLVLGVIMAFIAATAGYTIFYAVAPAAVLGAFALSLLELFVAFLQAYIFTFLSALFIGMAVHPH